jgi:hypothetical protein
VCAPFAAIGVMLWFALDTPRSWVARIVEAGLGTISVLVLVAVPLVLSITPRAATDSSARASYRSRSR